MSSNVQLPDINSTQASAPELASSAAGSIKKGVSQSAIKTRNEGIKVNVNEKELTKNFSIASLASSIQKAPLNEIEPSVEALKVADPAKATAKEVHQVSLDTTLDQAATINTNSAQLLEPLLVKKRIARSQNPSVQLKQAIERKQKMIKKSLILNQDILKSLQPSDTAMKSLIKLQRQKDQKQEKKIDKRITTAILDTEESLQEDKREAKIKKIRDKVSVERGQRSNALLRLNDSVAGFLLKQSIDKENKTIKKSYGYDSDDSENIGQTLNRI